MSKMGQELIAALQEAVAHAEGKTELRKTALQVRPVNASIEQNDKC